MESCPPRVAALLALGDALNASYHAVRQAIVPLGSDVL
jgi:hypothetical protein